MKTILVLSPHPNFPEAIRASLNADQYRVVHRVNADEAEPLIVHGLASAILLDTELMGVESILCIERLRRRDKKRPSSPSPKLRTRTGKKKHFCTASRTF